MKKLTAVLLSLVMALSLAAPAFAAPAPDAAPVDGAYTVDGEAVPVYKPGEAIPISAILKGLSPEESLGIIGGADGPTSIVIGGQIGSLDLGSINWDDLAEIPAPDSAGWAELEKELQRMRDEKKEAMGGVPGQIGVMVNGEYIKFPDATPEATDGRTMVPVRALVEALGGEVVYGDQEGLVRLYIDEYTILLTIGSTTAEMMPRGTEAGKENKSIEMDCAPYVKGGRTYVPVRFIAEALGYDVGWDAYYETAILLDQEALAADIDKDFTILNKVQASKSIGMEEGKNYQADVKGDIAVTLFDTLNGNQTYKADLTAKQLFNTEAASAQLSLKLSDNAMEELDKLLTSELGPDYEEDAAMLRTVVEGLEDMELILNRNGSAWFRMAALDELAGKDNVWMALDLGEEMGALAFASAGDVTIGKVLAQAVRGNSVTEWGSAMEMADMLSKLYGDDKFTTSNGTSTLTIDVDTLMGLYEDMGLSEDDMEEAKAAFKEYKITMKVDAKGGSDMTITMETAALSGMPAMKIAMDVKQDAGNVTMNMSYHIANMGEIELKLTETQKTTTGKPMTEPPEGAVVVDMDSPELLNP